MARNVNTYCPSCHTIDEQICDIDQVLYCHCGGQLEQQWWTRRRRDRTQWHESEAVVVFRKPDGSYSFPMRSDKPCPDGWEKIVARSDREVARIEREAGVRHQNRWFDNSGHGFDDDSTLRPVPRFRS